MGVNGTPKYNGTKEIMTGILGCQLTVGVDHEVHLVIGQNRTEVLPGEHIRGCVSTTVL